MICINCGSKRAFRIDNDFACPKCGYAWDVAHEQANAAFLAVQGRIPAQPVAQASTLAEEEALPEVVLLLKDVANAAAGVEIPPTPEPVVEASAKGKGKAAKSDQGDSDLGG